MITLQPWEVEDWELTDRREGINGWTKEKGEREREEDERREGSKTSLAGSRAHIQEGRFVHMPERHQTSADLPCRSVSMTTLSPGKLAWQQRGGERSGGGSERREGREGGGEEKKKKRRKMWIGKKKMARMSHWCRVDVSPYLFFYVTRDAAWWFHFCCTGINWCVNLVADGRWLLCWSAGHPSARAGPPLAAPQEQQ